MKRWMLAVALVLGALGAPPLASVAQAAPSMEELRDQGVLYAKKKRYKRAIATLNKAHAAPGGAQDFDVQYYRAQAAYAELLLEIAFESVENALGVAKSPREERRVKELQREMNAQFGGVTFETEQGETNQKGRIFFETKTGLINKDKKQRFSAIRERFRSTDISLPMTVYLPYGDYTANNVPFSIVQGQPAPTVRIFLQVQKDDDDGGALWWYVGAGSAAAVAVGVGVALLLADSEPERVSATPITVQ